MEELCPNDEDESMGTPVEPEEQAAK
jgi:hypothetical protein